MNSDSATDWVYPRVGGETKRERVGDVQVEGLSPRGRGNLRTSRSTAVTGRSIPAWAGKPSTCSKPARSTAVYPRVGGETPAISAKLVKVCGLSPRGRGNPAY